MHPVDHAQAVEAAKRIERGTGSGIDVDAMMNYILSLSAPGPSRDAEWCREFVRKVIAAAQYDINVCECWLAEDSESALAAELTAAIGGRGETSRAYDPAFGDERLCDCGHEYYRHFDSHEDMEPVGCKYCECDDFKPDPTEPAK